MSFNEALINGTTLMLVGMGTVFSFLCIMVFAMNIMSKVVAKLNRNNNHKHSDKRKHPRLKDGR